MNRPHKGKGIRFQVSKVSNLARPKNAQQEMVGFVLIVILVVIALMVFLVISVNKPTEPEKSIEVQNMLKSIMKHTTGCAIVFEPDFDNVEELVKSCYLNKECTNINQMACSYMNETITGIMQGVLKTESKITAYQVDFIQNKTSIVKVIPSLMSGVCEGRVYSATELIQSSSEQILIKLSLCY